MPGRWLPWPGKRKATWSLLRRQRGLAREPGRAQHAELAVGEHLLGLRQLLAQLGEVGRDHGQARGQGGALRQRPGQLARGGLRLLVELGEQLSDVLGQQGRGTGRQQEQLGPLACGRGALRLRHGRRVLQHDVDVGPAEAEAVHPDPARRAVGRPRHRLTGDPQAGLGHADRRVHVGLRLRHDGSVVQHQGGLDQAGHAGGAETVPDQALDGGEVGASVRPVLTVGGPHRLDGVQFGPVADDGRGAVRLDEADRVQRAFRVAVRPAQGQLLAPLAWRHRAVGDAVVGGADAAHHGVDPVARGERLVQRPEHDSADALAQDEPVRPAVEGPAHPGLRERADLGEPDQPVRGQRQVGATDDRLAAVTGAQVGDRLVQGDQAGGAGGVDREARPAEVVVLADRRGGHVEQHARHRERLDLLDVRAVLGVLRAAQSEEDTGGGPVERAAFPAGVLEGLAGDLEQQSVLRVHILHPARRHPEVGGVELVDSVDHRQLVGVGGLRAALVGRVEVLRVIPAVLGNRSELSAPAEQQAPVLLEVACPWEAAAHSYDRDVAHQVPRRRVSAWVELMINGRRPGGPSPTAAKAVMCSRRQSTSVTAPGCAISAGRSASWGKGQVQVGHCYS
jgi:hypothetical protein